MYAQDLFEYIASNTSLTIGVDWFYNYVPNESKVGLTLSLEGGDRNESGLNVLGLKLRGFFPSSAEAEQKIYEVYDFLVHSNGFTLPTGRIFNITSMQAPGFVGLDQNENTIYTAALTMYADRR